MSNLLLQKAEIEENLSEQSHLFGWLNGHQMMPNVTIEISIQGGQNQVIMVECLCDAEKQRIFFIVPSQKVNDG